jgi:hypothetical protein
MTRLKRSLITYYKDPTQRIPGYPLRAVWDKLSKLGQVEGIGFFQETKRWFSIIGGKLYYVNIFIEAMVSEPLPTEQEKIVRALNAKERRKTNKDQRR